jgi:hypothetical protein
MSKIIHFPHQRFSTCLGKPSPVIAHVIPPVEHQAWLAAIERAESERRARGEWVRRVVGMSGGHHGR